MVCFLFCLSTRHSRRRRRLEWFILFDDTRFFCYCCFPTHYRGFRRTDRKYVYFSIPRRVEIAPHVHTYIHNKIDACLPGNFAFHSPESFNFLSFVMTNQHAYFIRVCDKPESLFINLFIIIKACKWYEVGSFRTPLRKEKSPLAADYVRSSPREKKTARLLIVT